MSVFEGAYEDFNDIVAELELALAEAKGEESGSDTPHFRQPFQRSPKGAGVLKSRSLGLPFEKQTAWCVLSVSVPLLLTISAPLDGLGLCQHRRFRPFPCPFLDLPCTNAQEMPSQS